MKDIKNVPVLITGGASGIGRLAGLEFARLGARVVVWDLDAAAIKGLELEAQSQGLSISGMICDVSDREAVYHQAERLRASQGAPAILVNNAGVVSGKPFLDTPDEKIIRSINVNTLALFWTTRAFLPDMIRADAGHIVTVSSAAGLIGVTGLADYSASKFAAFGFHETLRMELRHRKSRVGTTVVCPFYIDTGMFQGVETRFPLFLPILKPEKVARAIVQAVLKNRKQLILPPFVRSIFFLRLLPAGILDAVADFMGISRSMDHFMGRAASTPAEGGTPEAAGVPLKQAE